METKEFKTLEDFQAEFDRLWKWRDLWTRLSNRSNRSDVQDKRSPNARFMASLQTRDEAVQRRAQIKNLQVRDLMLAKDKWDAEQTLLAAKPEIVQRSEPVSFYKHGKFEISAERFINILDMLEGTDPFFNVVYIADSKVRTYLETAGITKTNARGSSYICDKSKYENLIALLVD